MSFIAGYLLGLDEGGGVIAIFLCNLGHALALREVSADDPIVALI